MKKPSLILGIIFLITAGSSYAAQTPLTGIFKELEPGKMPVISVTNNGEQCIDTIMMGISLVDEDGNTLFSTGYTDMVAGSVWLAAGESKDFSLYITEAAQDRNPAGKEMLINEPKKIGVLFDIKQIVFMEARAKE